MIRCTGLAPWKFGSLTSSVLEAAQNTMGHHQHQPSKQIIQFLFKKMFTVDSPASRGDGAAI